MTGLASWIMSMISPLVSRVLISLGMGIATFTGVASAVNSALNTAKGYFSGLPLDVMALISRAGFFDAMAITSGGILSGLVWMQLSKMRFTPDGSSNSGG